jgi:hypothetical protein
MPACGSDVVVFRSVEGPKFARDEWALRCACGWQSGWWSYPGDAHWERLGHMQALAG